RVKPGSTVSAWYLPVAGSTQPKPPLPDSRTHRRPSYQRGECGIDRPRVTTSPEATSRRTPPLFLSARPPPGVSVVPTPVTKGGRPCAMHNPFRWQRSSGASAVMNGGRQRGTKLWIGLRVHRQEKRVLTNHNSGSSPTELPQAISWIWTSPVQTDERGRKQ